MKARLVHIYIATMCLGALAAISRVDWVAFTSLSLVSAWAFAILVLMAVVSEAMAVRLGVGGQGSGSTSVTFIPLLASVQLFGVGAAVLLMAVSVLFAEFVVQRKAIERALFNVSQLIVASALAGWTFVGLGGRALDAVPEAGFHLGTDQLLPFMAFGLVFLSANHAAVSLAIALSQGLRFSEVLEQMLGRSGFSGLQDLLISPIAIAVAFLYLQMGIPGILVVFFPLLFIRHAYSDHTRLREANSALLKALVKAIETRDPYTSGHSLRVAHLAKRIAEGMGLPRAAVGRIEQAALLHDIGKIEAPYTPILSKPTSLTREERAVIQSHVTKGEELLRNLSSFPDDVLRTVRHHHERVDGQGYPDGIMGSEIPVGARIVAVCDAVDAMLSDRPYRRALSLEAVRRELHDHAGRQFSPEIVHVLVNTQLLDEYADLIRHSRQLSDAPDLAGGYRLTPNQAATLTPGSAPGAERRLRKVSGAFWAR